MYKLTCEKNGDYYLKIATVPISDIVKKKISNAFQNNNINSLFCILKFR